MSREQIRQIWDTYRDILLFAVCLFGANLLWKLMIQGNEGTNEVACLGRDVTMPFRALSGHVARMVYGLTSLLSDSVHFRAPSSIAFDSGFSYMVVWSCTAVKQSFIWLVIMLAARGRWQTKLWYIPVGWLFAYAFNIFRIFMVALLTRNHPEWFELLHAYLFKYLFYGCFFLLWMVYDLRFGDVRITNE